MTAAPCVVTCHQPSYLPWAGLFHKLALADRFVVMDTVDYSPRNWLNRNRLKGQGSAFWLTVPVSFAASPSRALRDIAIDTAPDSGAGDWQRSHWRSLQHAYRRAPYWDRYADALEDIYLGATWTSLSELNIALLRYLAGVLGLTTEFVLASELGWRGRKSELVLDHCRRAAASVYVAGVNGHDYLVEKDFLSVGVSIVYQRYRTPEYRQRYGPFVADLSVVDMVFNEGPESASLLMRDNVTREDLIRTLRTNPGAAVLESTTVCDRPSFATRGAVCLESRRAAAAGAS